MENPIKIDDLGVPLFSETPILDGQTTFQKTIHKSPLFLFGAAWRFTLPETNSSPLKIGRAPKGNDLIATIHFQVQAVSFREIYLASKNQNFGAYNPPFRTEGGWFTPFTPQNTRIFGWSLSRWFKPWPIYPISWRSRFAIERVTSPSQKGHQQNFQVDNHIRNWFNSNKTLKVTKQTRGLTISFSHEINRSNNTLKTKRRWLRHESESHIHSKSIGHSPVWVALWIYILNFRGLDLDAVPSVFRQIGCQLNHILSLFRQNLIVQLHISRVKHLPLHHMVHIYGSYRGERMAIRWSIWLACCG